MTTFVEKSFSVSDYAKYRPTYPASLYDHIIAYHAQHNNGKTNVDFTVDVACGTGQATKEFAKRSRKVLGMDHSEVMIEQARSEVSASNVTFDVGNDLSVSQKVDAQSVDILAAAEAAHYFHWPEFWDEAARVLKPGGTLALFSYWTFTFPEYPEVAKIIDDYAYADDKCGPYWDAGRQYLNREYVDLVQFAPKDKFKDIEYRVNKFDKLRPDEPFEQTMKGVLVGEIVSMLKTWSPYFNYKRNNPTKPDIADAVMERITNTTGLSPSDKVTVKWNTVYILATRS